MKPRLGQVLMDMGAINGYQLQGVLCMQEKHREKLGMLMVGQGLITEEQLLKVLGTIWNLPYVQLQETDLDWQLFELIPESILNTYLLAPIMKNKKKMTLAIADPMNNKAIADLQMATGFQIIPVLASESDLQIVKQQYLAMLNEGKMLIKPLRNDDAALFHLGSKATDIQDNLNHPLTLMVDAILLKAVRAKASDIHIEPTESALNIRFRLDGRLYQVNTLPLSFHATVLSRLKILAGIDIAEKRIPQDGRLQKLVDWNLVDFRVATLPTFYGEKIVLRVLDKKESFHDLNRLGLTSENYKKMQLLSNRPHGLILATGPTGSGKTTALYALLGSLDAHGKNIITLEDPIEYSLQDVNQVQINAKAGLTFASGLKAVLRQDPDVIMVGEIRDKETAELAVHAALTGHLVLSTLHTNSAVGSIARLLDIGIEDYLLSAVLAGIMSQRLVRKLCPYCKEKYPFKKELAERFALNLHEGAEHYRSKGCPMCRHTGYQGRVAVHEIMVVGPRIRQCIEKGQYAEELLKAEAQSEGFVEIMSDGLYKVQTGITSLEEVAQALVLMQ